MRFHSFFASSSSQEGQRGAFFSGFGSFVFKGRPPGLPSSIFSAVGFGFLPLGAIAPTSVSWHKNRSLAAPTQVSIFSKIQSSAFLLFRGKNHSGSEGLPERFPSPPVPAFSAVPLQSVPVMPFS